MKTLLAPAVLIASAALLAAGPADDLQSAAAKLADAPNFTFTAANEFANAGFPAVPIHGVTEKGGFTVTTVEFNGNSRQTVRKGEQAVMQNRDGEWLTLEELRQQFAAGGGGGGPGRGGGGGFLGGGNRGEPGREIAALTAKLTDVKLVDGAITATLPTDEVARLLSFGRPRGDAGTGPKNASGDVKFWLKDGAIAKYVVHVKGTVTPPNGEERDIDLTSTTEITNIGTTRVVVPEAAKKKFGS